MFFLPLCVSWLWCERNLWELCAIAGLPNITLLGVIQQPDGTRWGKGERRDKSLSDVQHTQMRTQLQVHIQHAHTNTEIHTDTRFTTSLFIYEIIKHGPHSGSGDTLKEAARKTTASDSKRGIFQAR